MTCPTCPAPAGTVCLAIRTGHARYCDLAAVREDYRELVVAGSNDEPYEPPPDPADPELVARIQATPARTLGRIYSCPARTSSCNCLTKPADCSGSVVPERAGPVGFDDCLACLTSRDLA